MKTTDLLRKVQVAATRIGAQGVVNWGKRELQGYRDEDDPPDCRKTATPVIGHFTGPMQSQIKKSLPPYPGFEKDFQIEMRQPLITLQSFADGDEDPTFNGRHGELRSTRRRPAPSRLNFTAYSGCGM